MRPDTQQLTSPHRLPVVFPIAARVILALGPFHFLPVKLFSWPHSFSCSCILTILIREAFCGHYIRRSWPVSDKQLSGPRSIQSHSHWCCWSFSTRFMRTVICLLPVPGAWNRAHHPDIPDSLLIPARESLSGRAFLICQSHTASSIAIWTLGYPCMPQVPFSPVTTQSLPTFPCPSPIIPLSWSYRSLHNTHSLGSHF